MEFAYHLENGDLHHTLVKVRGLVFDDLDCDNLVRLHVLAFYDLAKRSLTQNIQNKVPSRVMRIKKTTPQGFA